jgi:hypothetical protein
MGARPNEAAAAALRGEREDTEKQLRFLRFLRGQELRKELQGQTFLEDVWQMPKGAGPGLATEEDRKRRERLSADTAKQLTEIDVLLAKFKAGTHAPSDDGVVDLLEAYKTSAE